MSKRHNVQRLFFESYACLEDSLLYVTNVSKTSFVRYEKVSQKRFCRLKMSSMSSECLKDVFCTLKMSSMGSECLKDNFCTLKMYQRGFVLTWGYVATISSLFSI